MKKNKSREKKKISHHKELRGPGRKKNIFPEKGGRIIEKKKDPANAGKSRGGERGKRIGGLGSLPGSTARKKGFLRGLRNVWSFKNERRKRCTDRKEANH